MTDQAPQAHILNAPIPNDQANRRPLKARSWKIMQAAARWLGTKNVTPNQISIASIGVSAVAALCLWGFMHADGALLWVLAGMIVLMMVARAFCNILDGLVAIEGGKRTKSGELFNDMPDRIADALILIGAGFATSWPDLGWLAALLAVMTAYTRTLARGVGAPADFSGPMSKVPRMAMIFIAAILMPVVKSEAVMVIALLIVSIGCVVTIWKRARSAYDFLEGQEPDLYPVEKKDLPHG